MKHTEALNIAHDVVRDSIGTCASCAKLGSVVVGMLEGLTHKPDGHLPLPDGAEQGSTIETKETIEAAARAYERAYLDAPGIEQDGSFSPQHLAGLRAARKVPPLPTSGMGHALSSTEYHLTKAWRTEIANLRAEVKRLNGILHADLAPEWCALSVSMAIARGQGAEKENVALRAEVERLTMSPGIPDGSNASKSSAGCDLGPVTEEELENAATARRDSPGREWGDEGLRDALNTILEARRARAGEPIASAASPYAGSPAHVALWDAINDYTRACVGDQVYGNTTRQNAVAAVEKAVRALLAGEPTVTEAEKDAAVAAIDVPNAREVAAACLLAAAKVRAKGGAK